MVKGLEKILKNTRNLLLAGAIGFTSLFINDSRIELVSYKEPEKSAPKIYTEIHSKLPKEKREYVVELFENLVPTYIEKCIENGWTDDDKCNKLMFNKIPDTINRLVFIPGTYEFDTRIPSYNQLLENRFDFSELPFNEYGYVLIGKEIKIGKENNCHYGKIDIETKMTDDSWTEYGLKEKKEHPVTLYYDIMQRNGFSHIWTPLGFTDNKTIYINKKRIEKDVDNFIEYSINEINEIKLRQSNPPHTTILTLLNLVAHPDISIEDLTKNNKKAQKYKNSSEYNMHLNTYNEIIKDKNYREKIINDIIKNIFIHEANHIYQNKIILSNCNEKHIKNQLDVDKLLIKTELLPYITEFAYASNYIMLKNILFAELFYDEIHGEALYELTELYRKELKNSSFTLEDLGRMSLEEIKDLSKRVFIKNFNELSNFNGCKIY